MTKSTNKTKILANLTGITLIALHSIVTISFADYTDNTVDEVCSYQANQPRDYQQPPVYQDYYQPPATDAQFQGNYPPAPHNNHVMLGEVSH